MRRLNNFSIFLFSILSLFFVIGCGDGSSSIMKGDRFETLESLQEVADIQGSGDYSDAFTCRIPQGAILEAAYNINSSGFFECNVVALGDVTDKEKILEALVPEGIRNRDGFRNFTITLSKEYSTTKLKALPKK